MVFDSTLFDLIKSHTAQIKLPMKIDKYNDTVKVRMNGEFDMLKLQYKLDVVGSTDDKLTSDSDIEKDIGEYSDQSNRQASC